MAGPGGSVAGTISGAINGAINVAGGGGGGMGGMLGGMASMLPGVGTILGGITKVLDLLGSVMKAGIQFGYNRIEGPTGNRNAMLQASQALSPASTMAGIKVQDYIRGLAFRAPVLGNFSDIMSAIQGGGDVGASLADTPQRNGYFAALRQMQTLNPGASVGTMAGNLSGYMKSVGSQQRGVFYGGGAFTMMGQGGRYKSLGEWAQGISKFLEERRPGPSRGRPFTRDELLAQNFPGSNINAWFQFMGVPDDMAEYWWQYALTKATGTGWSGDNPLENAVSEQRGMNLAQERLRNVTQGTKREFMMGTSMYPLYGARESADRRFNVAMGSVDMYLANMMSNTNMGTLISMMPTPIMELLMPLITKLASSPVGLGASAMGMLSSLIGDPDGPIGDPTAPVGDSVSGWGVYGGTSTSSLSPELAKRVAAMQQANPKVRITSGHRDAFTQHRLNTKGVGRVGPASRSQHTSGNAADLGPMSQMGWIVANAGKFGLDLATGAGEPWHAQVAGTMPHRYLGDPKKRSLGLGDDTPVGLPGLPGVDEIIGGVAGALAAPISGIIDAILGPLSRLMSGVFSVLEEADFNPMSMFVKKFLTGGTPIKVIDRATEFFGKAMLTPMLGLTKLLGSSNMSQDDYMEIIDSKSPVNVSLPKYPGYKGFKPEELNPFGDPYSVPINLGDSSFSRMSQPSGSPLVSVKESPIVFNNSFQISGVSSPQDARMVASTIASHLESELAFRSMREQ